jgi:predicted ArsR family transcriptional regulator
MSQQGHGFRFRQLHRALADPLRIKLLEYLIAAPRSAKELAGLVGMRPDRLYHHLARLEEAGLINVAEYRRLPGGKVERIYAATDVEPPGDDTSPAEVAQFFDAVIEVTRADMNSALMARDAGQRREVSLSRTALQLSDAVRAELVAGFERLVLEAQQKSDPAGTWTRIVFTVIDAQDRGRSDIT